MNADEMLKQAFALHTIFEGQQNMGLSLRPPFCHWTKESCDLGWCPPELMSFFFFNYAQLALSGEYPNCMLTYPIHIRFISTYE